MKRRYLLLAMALIVGCSSADSGRPKTYVATGTVTLKGQPVDGATVNFLPIDAKGNSAIGVTDASGKYSLTTYASNDGAVPGQYKVSIIQVVSAAPSAVSTLPPGQFPDGEIDPATYAPPKETGVVGTPAPPAPKNRIPTKYADADASGLQAKISDSGDNVNNFDLK